MEGVSKSSIRKFLQGTKLHPSLRSPLRRHFFSTRLSLPSSLLYSQATKKLTNQFNLLFLVKWTGTSLIFDNIRVYLKI